MIGQTVDEAHYVLYGKYLDLSYFDHPPLVGWTHFLFQKLPFGDVFDSRLPSILLSLLTSFLIFDYLKKRNVTETHSLAAVAILNLTPLFNTLSIALLPDSFLMPLTILINSRTEKILHQSTLKNWLWLGVFLGLAGLSKYTAILYVVALVLVFAYKKKISELLRPQLWAGVLAAFILVAPVLIWNIQNHFISFKYQGDHVSHYDANVFKNFFNSMGIQFFSWGLGPFLMALATHFIWVKNFRSLQTRLVSFIFLSVFLVFFIYISLAEVLLPHWMLIYFVLMIPLAYSQWLERKRNLWVFYISLIPSALFSIALLLETSFQIFPIQYTASLYEGVTGWDEIVAGAVKDLNQVQAVPKGLAVMNWTLGSRAMYYNKSDYRVFVLDDRFDQFDLWNKANPVGYSFVVMIEADKLDEHIKHLACSDLHPLDEKITKIKDVQVNHFLYYYCGNFLGYQN
ncbi:MAG: glycosyltransferase family 39 protein [Pseudobdellovibrio sp.]